jgi:hypothetical protein
MTIDFSLHRDQRRLAETKLAALSIDHPLREKYELWISQLDARLAVKGTSLSINTGALNSQRPGQTKAACANDFSANGTQAARDVVPDDANNASEPGKISGPAKTTENAASRTQRLLSQNKVLREMLERYEAPSSVRSRPVR